MLQSWQQAPLPAVPVCSTFLCALHFFLAFFFSWRALRTCLHHPWDTAPDVQEGTAPPLSSNRRNESTEKVSNLPKITQLGFGLRFTWLWSLCTHTFVKSLAHLLQARPWHHRDSQDLEHLLLPEGGGWERDTLCLLTCVALLQGPEQSVMGTTLVREPPFRGLVMN